MHSTSCVHVLLLELVHVFVNSPMWTLENY